MGQLSHSPWIPTQGQVNLALQRLKDDRLSDEARLEAFDEAYTAMQRLASDSGVAEEERSLAEQWLTSLRLHCQMSLPDVVSDLAELAGTAEDPEIRREASEALAKVSLRLRERGMDISRWQAGTGERLQ